MSTLADTPLATGFPSLQREGTVYLDTAATAQTQQSVLDAMNDYYEHHRGTVHRSVYPLAAEATELFEGARDRIAAWMNWPARATIFTKNATEAVNLVAYSWGRANVGPGDTVVVSEMEHHSNFVPWHMLCQEVGANFEIIGVDDECVLKLDDLDRHLATGTVKLVAVGHVSNAAGTINPVADIVERAHAAGAVVCVDGSQAVPQLPVDVGAIDADFYIWTGHKIYGPTGYRRAPRPRRDPRRDAAVSRRRAHDRVGLDRGDPLRHAARRSSRRGRCRSPRASDWAPRSTSSTAWGWTTSARTSTRSARTRCSVSARCRG